MCGLASFALSLWPIVASDSRDDVFDSVVADEMRVCAIGIKKLRPRRETLSSESAYFTGTPDAGRERKLVVVAAETGGGAGGAEAALESFPLRRVPDCDLNVALADFFELEDVCLDEVESKSVSCVMLKYDGCLK